MASTNKTQNLELSQYIGTDKPTYLGDYNSDMAKIDFASGELGLAIQQVATNLNTTDGKIGTLTNLNTTNKDSLVVAVNEVNTKATSNTTNIGTLANLNTDNKTTLVNALNEVNDKTTETFSTTEFKTNKVDIDGKPIYCTIVVLGDNIVSGSYPITALNVDHFITFEGTGIRAGATHSYGINTIDYEDSTYSAFFRSELMDWSTIVVQASNHTYNKIRYIIEYTKP